MIQGLLLLNYPQHTPVMWQTMLLMWTCLFVAVTINAIISRFLPKIEGVILILHVVGFFAIIVPLLYLAPDHGTASDVFTTFLNQGGWSSQGLSFWLGVGSTVFVFLGKPCVVISRCRLIPDKVQIALCMYVSTYKRINRLIEEIDVRRGPVRLDKRASGCHG